MILQVRMIAAGQLIRRRFRALTGQGLREVGSATWTRTKDHSINSRMLYQLSYRGMLKPEGSARVEDLISFAK